MDTHLRDLRYFVAVAEEGSFTRAAGRLFISQPAMSKQIRQLERQVRTPLFHRGPAQVSLTAAGVALLPHAREQLRLWAQAQRDVAAAAAADAAVLTVGIASAVSSGLLAAASAQFRLDNPGWRLQLRQVPWHDPSAGLGDATADVAVIWLPLPDPRRFSWRELASEPRHVALPRRHPLAEQARVAFADLLDEPFLALPDSAGEQRDFWLAVDARGGRPPLIAGVVTSSEETYEAIATGLGVALLSAGNAGIYQHSGVVTRPVTGLGPSRLAVAWRRDDDRPATASFVGSCIEAGRRGAIPPVIDPVPTPPAGRLDPPMTPAIDQLRIGVSGHTEPLQQHLLTAFTHSRPATAVMAVPSDSTASRVDGVAGGALDLAFVRLDRPPGVELDHRHLQTLPLLLAVPTAHRLAAQPASETVPLGALHREPLAFYAREQNPWWYDAVLACLREHGAEPRIVHRGLWAYDVLSQVAAGRAHALVSTAIAGRARLEGVVYRRLDPGVLTTSQGLLWRRDAVTPAVRRFLDTAEQLHPGPRARA